MDMTEKIILIIGAAFTAIGGVVGIIFAAVSDELGEMIVMIAIPGLFVVLGIAFIIGAMRSINKKKKILKKGKKYSGKIYGYVQNTSVMINGCFPSDTKVHYFDDRGIEREAILPTGFTDGSTYPIGMTIDIYELNGKYNYDPSSVRGEILPREEELMDDKPIDPGNVKLVGIRCPSCGSSFNATSGYSNKCPYCNSYINA